MTNKRKKISDKIKLKIFSRDNYTCKVCGRSPVSQSGLSLEVDHIIPFSQGGGDEESNYQTLCLNCNRGKGNNEDLNRTFLSELNAILNFINPQILIEIENRQNKISVIANQEDYTKLNQINSFGPFYVIEPSGNTICGYQAGKSLGIYTIHDNSGSKTHFYISHIN